MLSVFKVPYCRELLSRFISIQLFWGKIYQETTLHSKFVLLNPILNSKYFSLDLMPIFSSFYGRIENSIGYLPRFYRLNKPYIAFIESGHRFTHHAAPAYSYNWVDTDNSYVEEVESKSGKLKSRQGISRLSKRCLFQKFWNIMQKLPDIDRTGTASRVNYADEKSKAEEYQVCVTHPFING